MVSCSQKDVKHMKTGNTETNKNRFSFLIQFFLPKLKHVAGDKHINTHSAAHWGFKRHGGDQIDGGSSKALKRSLQITIASSGLSEASPSPPCLFLPPSLPPSLWHAGSCVTFLQGLQDSYVWKKPRNWDSKTRAGPTINGFSVILFCWQLGGKIR